MGHIANWRLCWRELMYVTLFVCSSQAIIQWQHSSVCAPSLAAGGEQLMGLHSSTDRAWARHLLCLSSLNSSSMLAGAPSAMQLLRPLLGIIMHLADHLLALLVRPWLLAALAGDPQYLSHLVVTVLVTAGVIWPTLRRHQVSTTRRTATHASLRLLYSTATLISAHTPGGMFRKYFVSVLAHGGRWKLSAGLAWCHGLLLQAPLALHLPLCLLDWGVAAYACNLIDADLGAPPRGWAQHALDGLLIVGVPLAVAALTSMCGTRSLPPEPSWTPSSCKPGASCVDHTQDGLQQQVSNSPAASSGEPGLSNWHSTPPAVVSAASPAAGARHRRRNQHLDGRRVLSAATDAPQGQGVPCHQPPGTRSAPAPATARPPPGSTLTQLAAAPYRPTSITGGSAERHAPHQQQLLPALVASCAQEGWRELPPGCWYTPVTQLVPVNMKVQHPAGVNYDAAAGHVTAAARDALSTVLAQQQVLTQLVTVPGCVLLLMEVVQRAAPAAAAGSQPSWSGRPALLQGAWQVVVATPAAGQPGAWATPLGIVPGGSGEAPQLQQHITRLLRDHAHASRPPSPGCTSSDAPGNTPPSPTELMQSGASNQPVTSCIIGTWGEPLQLQLVTSEGPCGPGDGALPLPGAVRVVVTHLQRVLCDEEVLLEMPGTPSGISSGYGHASVITTPSLALTCESLGACATASQHAHNHPTVLNVNILPATTPQHPGSSTPPSAALPIAHITLLLLPPEPAAELAGWVAARQLPAAYVSSWSRDLAVLVGCADRLRVVRACPLALQAMPSALGGSTKQDPLQLCHLAVAAAGQLDGLFSGCGLGCVGDLVAVCKQRVLVGATALAPMAAGHVVPAAAGGSAGEQALGSEAAAPASNLRVIVAAMLPSSAAAASPGACGTGRADGREEGMSASTEPADGTLIITRGSSSSYHKDASSGPQAMAGAGSELGSDSTPTSSRSPSNGSSISVSSKLSSSPPPPAPLVSPAEAAAVSGAGWGAWLRGFRCPVAEAAFQSYRGAALRRWDWVCRVYVVVLGAAMVAKKVQVLEVPWVSWEAAPVWLTQGELTMHVLLLGLAPRWWAAHRDAVLATYHGRVGALWLWEALAWPPQTFRAVYGTTSRLVMLPVSFMVIHKGPWASVLGCALVCPFAYVTLLLQARDCGEAGGLDGALHAGIQGRSGLLVVAGMVFCAINLLLALMCSLVVEVWVGRAWVRSQAARLPSRPLQVSQDPDAALSAAGSSLATTVS